MRLISGSSERDTLVSISCTKMKQKAPLHKAVIRQQLLLSLEQLRSALDCGVAWNSDHPGVMSMKDAMLAMVELARLSSNYYATTSTAKGMPSSVALAWTSAYIACEQTCCVTVKTSQHFVELKETVVHPPGQTQAD